MNIAISKARVRAYARVVLAGIRSMNEVEEDYKVLVYVEMINKYGYKLKDVEDTYREEVEALLKG